MRIRKKEDRYTSTRSMFQLLFNWDPPRIMFIIPVSSPKRNHYYHSIHLVTDKGIWKFVTKERKFLFHEVELLPPTEHVKLFFNYSFPYESISIPPNWQIPIKFLKQENKSL